MGQIIGAKLWIGGHFAKLCGLLRIYELYQPLYFFQVDKGTLDFEKSLADILLDFSEETNNNQDGSIKTYVSLARSFDDLANQAIGADIPRIIGGVSIVYAYVLMMLGGFDCVQQKVQL